MRKFILCTVGLTLLAACQTSDDYLYKKYSSYAEYGYKDRLKDDGTYWLSFLGTRRTTQEQVKKYWIQHANNLCNGHYNILTLEPEIQIWKENQFNSGAGNADSRIIEIKKPFLKGTIECVAEN